MIHIERLLNVKGNQSQRMGSCPQENPSGVFGNEISAWLGMANTCNTLYFWFFIEFSAGMNKVDPSQVFKASFQTSSSLRQSEQLPGRWNLLAPSNLLCVIFIITKLAVLSCGILGNVVFFSLNPEILNDVMFLLHKVEAGMEVEQSSTLRRRKELWPKL